MVYMWQTVVFTVSAICLQFVVKKAEETEKTNKCDLSWGQNASVQLGTTLLLCAPYKVYISEGYWRRRAIWNPATDSRVKHCGFLGFQSYLSVLKMQVQTILGLTSGQSWNIDSVWRMMIDYKCQRVKPKHPNPSCRKEHHPLLNDFR